MDPFQIDHSSDKKTISLDAEQLVRIVPSGILQLTCNNGKIDMYYASDGYFDIIGYSKKEYQTLTRQAGNNLPAFYRNTKEVMESLAKCLQSEDHKILIDLSLDHKKGHVIWLRAEGIARPTGHNCYDIQCSLTDISDIKALQF
ncbi:MAG: PAS domain-containing protein, partial [Eubacterium sp.]